jgi:HEAT repeat protein
MSACRSLILLLLLPLACAESALAQTAPRDGNIPVDVNARINDLASPDPNVRAMAACSLGRAGAAATQAIPRLIQILSDETPTGRINCYQGTPSKLLPETSTPADEAVKALVAIGKPAVEPLQAALGSQDARIRTRAVKALGRIGDEDSTNALTASAREAGAHATRLQAVRSLGRVGGSQSLEALRVALNDENEQVRREAAWALGRRGDAPSLEALLGALNDPSWQVRAQAARGLNRIRSERAVEPLSAALGDQRAEVRLEVVKALGHIGGERAVETLRVALNDESQIVSRQAQRALARLKGTRSRRMN